MKRLFCIACCCVLLTGIRAQNPTVDSLQKVFNAATSDTQKINLQIQMGDVYYWLRNDSCLPDFKTVLEQSQQKKHLLGELHARNRHADFIFRFKNDDLGALALFLLNVRQEEANGDTKKPIDINADDYLRLVYQGLRAKDKSFNATLGLSLRYDVVTKGRGGELKVLSKEGEGATFIIELPLKHNQT